MLLEIIESTLSLSHELNSLLKNLFNFEHFKNQNQCLHSYVLISFNGHWICYTNLVKGRNTFILSE